MRIVTVTEAKNGLSALIDLVQSGETVVIVDRGRPVARLDTALSSALDDPHGRLARLQRAGVVQVAQTTPARLEGRPPTMAPGASATRDLIEERRNGR